MVDDRGQVSPTPREVASVKLTFEDRVLNPLSISAHRLRDAGQTLLVRDVVADEEGPAHRSESVGCIRRLLRGVERPFGKKCSVSFVRLRRLSQFPCYLPPQACRLQH